MLLSIVTIHLNDFEGFENTTRSLRAILPGEEVEWIVVDGGSDTGADEKGILDQVQSLADHFVSEPDDGIYNAMNKGTQLAKGDYVLYLNAGDELHPGFDTASLKNSLAGQSPGMVWGYCEVRYPDDTQVQVKTRSQSWAWYCMPAFHPATFFRRDDLGDNPYDTTYKLAADYDLVCRLLAGKTGVTQLEQVVSVYHRGGASDIHGDAAREEENHIRLKHFRVPAIIGKGIMSFKKFNARQSPFSRFTRQLRKWV